jgi:muramoyltetrapeptide carboxypeptidase
LEQQGLKPRVPLNIQGEDILCSQKDEIRFEHLKKALTAKDSKAIWCLRGGYGAIRLIEKIAKIKKPTQPKVLIGYSDTVTLHNFLNQVWKWPSLHGPLLDRLGQNTLSEDQVRLVLDVVFGRVDKVIHSGLKPLNERARKLKSLKGRVYGGNLAVTQTLLGTFQEKTPRDAIMVFEDIGERGYRIDKMLVQLRMAGYFKSTKAIVFGQLIESKDPNGEDRVPAVIQRFADEMKIPMFTGLQIGHGDLQRVVPLATPATLTANGETAELSILTGCQVNKAKKK